MKNCLKFCCSKNFVAAKILLQQKFCCIKNVAEAKLFYHIAIIYIYVFNFINFNYFWTFEYVYCVCHAYPIATYRNLCDHDWHSTNLEALLLMHCHFQCASPMMILTCLTSIYWLRLSVICLIWIFHPELIHNYLLPHSAIGTK